MNQKNTHSNRWKIVVEKPEIPPSLRTGAHEPSQPTPAKEEPPKWRNLTLAEMYVLLEEAKRQEALTQ